MNLIIGALIITGIVLAAWILVAVLDMITRDEDGYPQDGER